MNGCYVFFNILKLLFLNNYNTLVLKLKFQANKKSNFENQTLRIILELYIYY